MSTELPKRRNRRRRADPDPPEPPAEPEPIPPPTVATFGDCKQMAEYHGKAAKLYADADRHLSGLYTIIDELEELSMPLARALRLLRNLKDES